METKTLNINTDIEVKKSDIEAKKQDIRSINFNNITVEKEPTIKTNINIFDKFFSAKGGLVLKSAIFVTGSSGAGKTTLMCNMMKWLKEYKTSFYSREMRKESLKEQVLKLNINHNNAYFSDENTCANFDEYMAEIDILKPKVIIIDSIQTIALEDYLGKGIMSEDAACLHIVSTLRRWVCDNNAVLFLIGHVTKDDVFAGKNTIMQFMDAHLELIFNKKDNTRKISWGQKNRKGPMGTLYYTINNNTEINFYSEEEYELMNRKEFSVLDEINEKINEYIIFLQKDKESYNIIREELKVRIKEIEKEYNLSGNDLECVINKLKIVNEY